MKVIIVGGVAGGAYCVEQNGTCDLRHCPRRP